MRLLSKIEIEDIFSSNFFYESGSVYIIDQKTKTYQTDKHYANLLEYANSVRQAFLTGHTIIVKQLENYNSVIQKKCAELGGDVDVHMYLVPSHGTSSFDYHVDDRDVWVHMVYGEKEFHLREKGLEKKSLLRAGDFLFIAKDIEHKAIPRGASCLLSFGVASKPVSYKIPVGITAADLETSLEGV